MDFRGHSGQAAPASPSTPAGNIGGQSGPGNNRFGGLGNGPIHKWFKVGSVTLLFAVTALVIALTFLLAFGGNSQMRSVQKNKYQAVFLNNGQVYFGNIKAINNKTLNLQNIYYLQTSGNNTTEAAQTTGSNVSLVKLGCELHAPFDQMIVNNDQVIFWENLQDSGQVVKAITEYKKTSTQQSCSQQSQSSTQQAPSTTTPTSNPTTTTPTPAPKKQ